MGNVISRRRALVAFCSFVGKCHTHMHTLVGPDLGSVMSLMYEQCSEHRDMHAFYPWSGARSPFCSKVPERENESLRKELHGCFQHTLLGDLGIQLPWMAPKDTDNFPHHLLPRLNDHFQNSVLPSIFSNSEHFCVFIHKNCQCAICTNMTFMHHLWLHKW